MSDRQDTDHFTAFVDFENDAVHIAFGAVEQLPQSAFGLFLLSGAAEQRRGNRSSRFHLRPPRRKSLDQTYGQTANYY